jgi:mono/diheme cytochrome c family protein
MKMPEERRRNPRKAVVSAMLFALAISVGTWVFSSSKEIAKGANPNGIGQAAARPKNEAASRAAFLQAYQVLMHPRCMNCHPAGDAPLQGDDSHPHAQNVQRGRDGKGKYALKCANCHQLTNLPGKNMPPGNPNWHLPPPEMPLVFEGKTPRELARQLKDPEQNGRKTLAELLHHVTEDKLVLGGWEPGEGRTKPPLTHADFVRKVREWIENGAAEPE